MLSYFKISSMYGNNKGNFLNSLIINIVYLILIIPGIIFIRKSPLSRYWFFILLVIYTLIYSRLYSLIKK